MAISLTRDVWLWVAMPEANSQGASLISYQYRDWPASLIKLRNDPVANITWVANRARQESVILDTWLAHAQFCFVLFCLKFFFSMISWIIFFLKLSVREKQCWWVQLSVFNKSNCRGGGTHIGKWYGPGDVPRSWSLFSGQSALFSLPIYHQCATHVPPLQF